MKDCFPLYDRTTQRDRYWEEVEAGSLGLWPKRSSHRHSVYLSGEKIIGVVQQRAYSR